MCQSSKGKRQVDYERFYEWKICDTAFESDLFVEVNRKCFKVFVLLSRNKHHDSAIIGKNHFNSDFQCKKKTVYLWELNRQKKKCQKTDTNL